MSNATKRESTVPDAQCTLALPTGDEVAARLAKRFGVTEEYILDCAALHDDLEAIAEVDKELRDALWSSRTPPGRKDIKRAAEAARQGLSPRAVLGAGWEGIA